MACENPISKAGRHCLTVCILYLACCNIAACSGKRQQKYTPGFEVIGRGRKILTLGVPGQSFYESTDLIVRYLNDHLDSVTIKTVACGIDDYEHRLRNDYFDLTIINGTQLLDAERRGYRVVGRIADDETAVIFVHKDSDIHKFSDIRGHTISLPGQSTLSGTMMPLLYLYRQGVDVKDDIRRLTVPSFESAILSVYLGHASLGAAWRPAWDIYLRDRPEIRAKLEARWETPPLINAAVLFRRSIDSDLAAKLADLFFRMNKDEQGRRALQRVQISGFVPADSNSFRPVADFIREFHATIH